MRFIGFRIPATRERKKRTKRYILRFIKYSALKYCDTNIIILSFPTISQRNYYPSISFDERNTVLGKMVCISISSYFT